MKITILFSRFTKQADKDDYAQKWSNTTKPQPKQPSKSPVTESEKLQMMSDALFEFSIGSSGIIPAHKSLLSDPSVITPVSNLY